MTGKKRSDSERRRALLRELDDALVESIETRRRAAGRLERRKADDASLGAADDAEREGEEREPG